jgi:hypothetical protein
VCRNEQTSPFAGRHRRTGPPSHAVLRRVHRSSQEFRRAEAEKTSCRSNSFAARRSYKLVASLRSTSEAWRICGGGVTDQQTGATDSLHDVFRAITPVRLHGPLRETSARCGVARAGPSRRVWARVRVPGVISGSDRSASRRRGSLCARERGWLWLRASGRGSVATPALTQIAA